MKAVIVRPASLRPKSYIFHISPIYFKNRCINTTAWSVRHVSTFATLPRGTQRTVSVILPWFYHSLDSSEPPLPPPQSPDSGFWKLISQGWSELGQWMWSLRWERGSVIHSIMMFTMRCVPLGSVAMCSHASHFMRWCLYIDFWNIWAIYEIYGIWASVMQVLQ